MSPFVYLCDTAPFACFLDRPSGAVMRKMAQVPSTGQFQIRHCQTSLFSHLCLNNSLASLYKGTGLIFGMYWFLSRVKYYCVFRLILRMKVFAEGKAKQITSFMPCFWP